MNGKSRWCLWRIVNQGLLLVMHMLSVKRTVIYACYIYVYMFSYVHSFVAKEGSFSILVNL